MNLRLPLALGALAALLASPLPAAPGDPNVVPNPRPTSGAGWRALGEKAVRQGNFPLAAAAYRGASDFYRGRKDLNTAKFFSIQADRYDTQVFLTLERDTTHRQAHRYYTGRRLEPLYGCYLGACIDREDSLPGKYLDENSQWHRDSAEWNDAVGRPHAVFFMYQSYGTKFPGKWFAHLREHGAAGQWVLSPKNLDEVQDSEYLRGLAQSAGASGAPIFLRFAGEMNGDWVPYSGDPAKYIRTFRLVSDTFHAYAPNVALVWCPNDVPETKINAYYPGERWVDWVGVNFYSVPFNDADINRPARWRNPADNLKYIYKTYAARHPIMIGETAASHQSAVDNKPCPDFASDKIAQLYSALPRLYPRVKAVHWLSMNTFKHARAERQLNNYAILDSEEVTSAYREMIRHPHYLETITLPTEGLPQCAPVETERLRDGARLSGRVTLSAWIKTYEQRPKVNVLLNGKPLNTFDTPGHYRFEVDTAQFDNGPKLLSIEVRDSKGFLAGRQIVKVTFAN